MKCSCSFVPVELNKAAIGPDPSGFLLARIQSSGQGWTSTCIPAGPPYRTGRQPLPAFPNCHTSTHADLRSPSFHIHIDLCIYLYLSIIYLSNLSLFFKTKMRYLSLTPSLPSTFSQVGVGCFHSSPYNNVMRLFINLLLTKLMTETISSSL